MNTSRLGQLPEGVGKKIVDALKKDAIEIKAIEEEEFDQRENLVNEEFYNSEFVTNENFNDEEQDEDFKNVYFETEEKTEILGFQKQQQQAFSSAFNIKQQPKKPEEEMPTIEMPANIDILKRLISQLPPGVTRQTGAQIIRQTMEAMGISMKSVLSEAQFIQEELGNSAQDCTNTIEEYTNNIRMLEKRVQNYRKQANQIGELINLFIMTEKKVNR